MIGAVINAMEKGWLPDVAIRMGIRRLCKTRLESFRSLSADETQVAMERYLKTLREGPVAAHTADANRQHYELPPAFFERVLGRNLKYSSGFWPDGCDSLDASEEASLAETCRRADLKDGQRILELGCGWGSLTLTMARKFPNATIIAVSNSAPQRLFIEARAKNEGLTNVRVLTRNVATLEAIEIEPGPFDRIVSVEMFEHMMNYEKLLERIARWLAPGGKLFVHIFTHREYAYPFETDGDDNWMGKYFFTGGQMPSHDLLSHFQKDMVLEQDWKWSGDHYARTSEAWLENMDRRREEIMSVMKEVYGAADAARWFQRWRIFFMACAELFGYQGGREWGVSHYRFAKRETI